MQVRDFLSDTEKEKERWKFHRNRKNEMEKTFQELNVESKGVCENQKLNFPKMPFFAKPISLCSLGKMHKRTPEKILNFVHFFVKKVLTDTLDCDILLTEGQKSYSIKRKTERQKMKNQNFKATLIRRNNYGTEEYRIENFDGMTENEIINACDRNNFGGRVYGNTAVVYID